MTRQEYEQLKKKAEAEYRLNMEAIERVFQMSQGFLSGAQRTLFEEDEEGREEAEGEEKETDEGEDDDDGGSPNGDESFAFRKGEVLRAVKAAIGRINTDFTIIDIHENLIRHGVSAKKGSVRSVLKQLEGDGTLEVVSQGIGRRATLYRRMGN